MIRAAELLLFAAPLGIYLLGRLLLSRALPGPSRHLLAAIFAGLLLAGAGLAWMSWSERSHGDTHYVPAELRDGRVVPGHGA